MHISSGDRRIQISDELNKKITELNSQKFTKLDRFAIWINQQIGSFRFFLLLLAWTILWLFWNTFGPVGLRFDPFPAFVPAAFDGGARTGKLPIGSSRRDRLRD